MDKYSEVVISMNNCAKNWAQKSNSSLVLCADYGESDGTTELNLNCLLTLMIILIKTTHPSSTHSLTWWLVNKTCINILLLLPLSFSGTTKPHLPLCPFSLLFKPNPYHLRDHLAEACKAWKARNRNLSESLDYEIKVRRSLWFAQYHTVSNGRLACTIFLNICITIRKKKKKEDTGSVVVLSSPISMDTLGGYTMCCKTW